MLIEEFATRLSDISISFFHDVQLHYPIAWTAINDVSEVFITILEELYQQGMDQHLFRPMSIELLKELDRYFVTHMISNQKIFKDPNYTLKVLVEEYLALRLNGLEIKLI